MIRLEEEQISEIPLAEVDCAEEEVKSAAPNNSNYREDLENECNFRD